MGTARPPNKRMQLTKLRAAPERQAEVPPCAPAGESDGGTASQLIRSVRPTRGGSKDSLQCRKAPAGSATLLAVDKERPAVEQRTDGPMVFSPSVFEGLLPD